jgi:chemotaxis protein MotB
MAAKSGKITPSNKTVVHCYQCGTGFSIDLSRLPPDVLEIKCLNCEIPVPILARVVKKKNSDGAAQSSGSPPEKRARQNHSDLDEDIHAQSLGGGSAEAEGEEGMQWLATYGDMMSILLIFFVLLFAISTVDKRKFEVAMTSISDALGRKITFPKAPEKPPAPPESIEELKARVDAASKLPSPLETFKQEVQVEKQAFSDLRKELKGFIDEHGLQDKLSLLDEDEGLVLIAQDMVMFDLGRADIRPEVLPNLQEIASIMKNLKNNIVVEGHTDDLPISSGRFASNWELSVMRATNVVHFFVIQCGLDPSRLAAAGYASYRPRYSNKSADREKNRRIELVVKKKYSDKLVDELLVPKQ